MPEPRLARTRATLKPGYQFGDARSVWDRPFTEAELNECIHGGAGRVLSDVISDMMKGKRFVVADPMPDALRLEDQYGE